MSAKACGYIEGSPVGYNAEFAMPDILIKLLRNVDSVFFFHSKNRFDGIQIFESLRRDMQKEPTRWCKALPERQVEKSRSGIALIELNESTSWP